MNLLKIVSETIKTRFQRENFPRRGVSSPCIMVCPDCTGQRRMEWGLGASFHVGWTPTHTNKRQGAQKTPKTNTRIYGLCSESSTLALENCRRWFQFKVGHKQLKGLKSWLCGITTRCWDSWSSRCFVYPDLTSRSRRPA